jgi:hypothetical protein
MKKEERDPKIKDRSTVSRFFRYPFLTNSRYRNINFLIERNGFIQKKKKKKIMQVDHLEAVLGDVVITAYEGEYDDENGEYSGPGIAKLDNENNYEGEFDKGFFHGKGKFTWSNGMNYEGDFSYNKITGSGTYTYLDGSTYVGQVLDGKRHGNGKLTTSIGQIYDGEWENGKRHGNGKMIYNEDGNYHYTVSDQDPLSLLLIFRFLRVNGLRIFVVDMV